MKAEDIYPKLAVWVRAATYVWPGIVTQLVTDKTSHYPKNGCWVKMDFDTDLTSIPNRVYGEAYEFMEYLEPRDPNNLDEVPPLPLINPITIMDESGIPIGQFGAW